MTTDKTKKKQDGHDIAAENELYFPEYIKAQKEEEDPENINYKGRIMTAEERMEYENDLEKKNVEDYGDKYMNPGK